MGIDEIGTWLRTEETKVKNYEKVFAAKTGRELGLIYKEAEDAWHLIYQDASKYLSQKFPTKKALLEFVITTVLHAVEREA